MGDLPTTVVATTVAVATTVVEDHRTTTMEVEARSPSTPLTSSAERSLAAVATEVANLSIPSHCSVARNQAAVAETDDRRMESQVVEQGPAMELVGVVSFLDSACPISAGSRMSLEASLTQRRYSHN